jgi:UDP-glucose 4-epimerase
MKILVTGGAGYIGSHVVHRLMAKKHNFSAEVIVVDDLSTGFTQALPNSVHFQQGDVRDEEFIFNILTKYNIEAVIHLAAKLNIPESILKPEEYYDCNVNGVFSLTKACQRSGVKYIVFSSSATVYGDANFDQTYLSPNLLTENSKLAPLNPYGWSKLQAEKILSDCDADFGLKSISLRYFNAAGASDDGRIGQRSQKSNHLIQMATQVAAGKKENLSIYGSDYPTEDGTCIRDYIHVEDLAEVHLLALKYLIETNSSDIFNCGYGHGYSVQQIVDCVNKVSGQKICVQHEARREGDAIYSVADVQKIKKILKWIPQRDDIELICKSAYDWEKKLSADLKN